MNRKEIAREISAHHLGLAHKEVTEAISAAFEEAGWPYPNLLINAVMGRVAPHMLAACERAIDVERADTYEPINTARGGNDHGYNNVANDDEESLVFADESEYGN